MGELSDSALQSWIWMLMGGYIPRLLMGGYSDPRLYSLIADEGL